jgi:hypothetical protein
MNWMAMGSFPADSNAPKGSFSEQLDGLRAAGFDGIQFSEPATSEQLAPCREKKN